MSAMSARSRVPDRVERGANEAAAKPSVALRGEQEKGKPPQRASCSFLSAVSHEMAQPLTILRGSLELALEKEWSAEEQRAWLEQALEQADRLIQLNVFLREMAEAETVDDGKQKASLSTLINDLAVDLLPLAEVKNLRLVVQCEDNLTVIANERRLQQALVNVIGYAINHAPEEGVVRLSLKRSGAEACLEVSDTGPGMSPDEMTRLFDPFYYPPSLPRIIDQNALALSVAKRIIETIDGTIRVESETEQGRCFHIRLPLA